MDTTEKALLEEWSKFPSNGIDPATYWQRKAVFLGRKLDLIVSELIGIDADEYTHAEKKIIKICLD